MATKNVPVKKERKENLPAIPFDMTADAGKGTEGADKDSYAIPFIICLQSGSPAVADELVPGAKPGLFMNTITMELFREVTLIPCAYQRKYIQWAQRDHGGGFKGLHNPVAVDSGQIEGVYRDPKTGQLMIGEDILSDTRMHYIVAKSANGAWFPAVLSLTSTQIKKSKRFMSLIAGLEFKDEGKAPYNPPSFGSTYLMTSVKENNDKGTWYGVDITVGERVTDGALYAKCKHFNEESTAGMIQTQTPSQQDSADNGDGKF